MTMATNPNRREIRKATNNSLMRAHELGIGSIAFPALGTGFGGFPPPAAEVK